MALASPGVGNKVLEYHIENVENEQMIPKRKGYNEPHKVIISKFKRKPNSHYKHKHKKRINRKQKNEKPEGPNNFMKRKPKGFKSSGILQRSKLGGYLSNFKPI